MAPYWNALGNCYASFKQLGTSGKSHMNITSSKILKQHERLRIFFFNGNTTKPNSTEVSVVNHSK